MEIAASKFAASERPDSLFSWPNSLFAAPVSLISRAGKTYRSAYSSGRFADGTVAIRPKLRNFPEKFPICREIAWRRVRSALRRQPRIPPFCQASRETGETAGNPGFSRIGFGLRTPVTPKLRRKYRKERQAQQAAYVARVSLPDKGIQTEQGFMLFEPGMAVTAEIKTGQRRVISYLLSLLMRYRDEAGRER